MTLTLVALGSGSSQYVVAYLSIFIHFVDRYWILKLIVMVYIVDSAQSEKIIN